MKTLITLAGVLVASQALAHGGGGAHIHPHGEEWAVIALLGLAALAVAVIVLRR